jgi:hypothetical protein
MGRGRGGRGREARHVRRQPGGAGPVAAARDCAGCGRAFTWRPALAEVWDEVRWCSDACRRRGIRPVDTALEVAIAALLDEMPGGATVCPSEAARRVAPGDDPEDWRVLMEPARRAARRMVAAGTLEILQQGRIVDPSTAKGPIRLRRVRSVG